MIQRGTRQVPPSISGGLYLLKIPFSQLVLRYVSVTSHMALACSLLANIADLCVDVASTKRVDISDAPLDAGAALRYLAAADVPTDALPVQVPNAD